MNITQLTPCPCDIDADNLAAEVASAPRHSPFADTLIGFCDALSRTLFEESSLRRFPEVQSLAFWLRKASVARLSEQLSAPHEMCCIKAPRGLAFHICPSNVETMFVYSWIVSLLCGNSNIIRLSSKHSHLVSTVCALVNGLLARPEFLALRRSNAIVTYAHDSEATETVSRRCDVRVIWGGNSTIHAVRAIPCKVSAKEIVFPDRYSFAVLRAETFLVLTGSEQAELAQRFFNDAYWFGQMACSSPRSVVWIGSSELVKEAQARFIDELQQEIRRREFTIEPGTALDKLAETYDEAAGEEGVEVKVASNECVVISHTTFHEFSQKNTAGGGFFHFYNLNSLDGLVPKIRPSFQTLAYFGFTGEEMQTFVLSLLGNGIDRAVPIGSALAFDVTWDGYNLVNELTKTIPVVR